MFGRERVLDAAYGCLLEQEWRTLPVEPEAFKLDAVILSFQAYAQLAEIPVTRLLKEPALAEGCSVSGLHGRNILLFNADAPVSRQRFTVAHELGHLLLGHTLQDGRQESEADYFASVLLMPDALLAALQRRRLLLTEAFLMRIFGVSAACARRKRQSLLCPPVPHPLDERIETLFYTSIARLAPLPPVFPGGI